MRDDELPSLNAIQSFEAAARHLRFTTAAKELCVSQGAVSRMVRQLETDIGKDLFVRVGRGLELTPAGLRYFLEISPALANIRRATRTVRGTTAMPSVKVAVLPTFAMQWLMPKLGTFTARNPGLIVDIFAKDATPDIMLEEADLCVGYGTGNWPNVIATLLFREEVAVYAAPSLHASSLNDLHELPLLIHSTRPCAWNDFFAARHVMPRDLTRYQRFEHFFMIIEAAKNGMGAALLPTFIAEQAVRAGDLVALHPKPFPTDFGYYVCRAASAVISNPITLFERWLQEAAQQS